MFSKTYIVYVTSPHNQLTTAMPFKAKCAVNAWRQVLDEIEDSNRELFVTDIKRIK